MSPVIHARRRRCPLPAARDSCRVGTCRRSCGLLARGQLEQRQRPVWFCGVGGGVALGLGGSNRPRDGGRFDAGEGLSERDVGAHPAVGQVEGQGVEDRDSFGGSHAGDAWNVLHDKGFRLDLDAEAGEFEGQAVAGIVHIALTGDREA